VFTYIFKGRRIVSMTVTHENTEKQTAVMQVEFECGFKFFIPYKGLENFNLEQVHRDSKYLVDGEMEYFYTNESTWTLCTNKGNLCLNLSGRITSEGTLPTKEVKDTIVETFTYQCLQEPGDLSHVIQLTIAPEDQEDLLVFARKSWEHHVTADYYRKLQRKLQTWDEEALSVRFAHTHITGVIQNETQIVIQANYGEWIAVFHLDPCVSQYPKEAYRKLVNSDDIRLRRAHGGYYIHYGEKAYVSIKSSRVEVFEKGDNHVA